MSEQIPSILITLTVLNTSVAIYSNDLTKTKDMTLKSTKHLKNKENITKSKKNLKKCLKHKKHVFILLYKNIENVFFTSMLGWLTVCGQVNHLGI